MGRKWEQWQILDFLAPKSLRMITAAMKKKKKRKEKKNPLAAWKKNYDKPRESIKKQRYHFADKGPYSQSYGVPVVM